jgi:endonuclease/exonuclease/phosphatase (EEP) superfamily protein YafD
LEPWELSLSSSAATLASLAVPFTLGRAAGGFDHSPLPALAALAPLGGVLAATGMAVALLARARWMILGTAVLVALHVSWVLPSLRANPGPPVVGENVTVMEVNAYEGRADAYAIVQEVRRRDVDVLVVAELTPILAAELDAEGLPGVLGNSTLGPRPHGAGTGIYSRLPLRALPDVGRTGWAMPRASLTVAGGSPLTLTAVHVRSPRPGQVGAWAHDLDRVVEATAATGGAQLVVGDFNASRDHAGFRAVLDRGRLADAADVVGAGSWPGYTWPAGLPVIAPFVRLDHVLLTPNSVRVRGLDVVDIPGTDHRAIVAALVVAR